MPHKSRLPIPIGAQSTHPLYRIRSESCLKATPGRTLPRLRSLGQLSPPPDEALPPLPLRSPYRPSIRARGIVCPKPLSTCIVKEHPPSAPSDSSSSQRSHYSQVDEADDDHSSGRNTMLIQDNRDQKKIEFILHRNRRQVPNLNDLSQILHLRGRLQEIGTTFSPEGEMLTFGNPPLDADLEQMLRLGLMYDEQWNMFFKGNNTANMPDGELWSDLRVLKKMLLNEGIHFDDHHKRLNYGTSDPKLIRMSDHYDLLRKEWLAKTPQNVHPAYRPRLSPEEVSKTTMNLGWSFHQENGADGVMKKKKRRSSRLKVVVEEQPSIENGPDPTVVQEELQANMTYPLSPVMSEPITPNTSAGMHNGTKQPTLALTETVAARSLGHALGTSSLGTSALILPHRSSSMQVTNTANTLQREADFETRDIRTESGLCQGLSREHAGVLAVSVEDERGHAEERRRVERLPHTGERQRVDMKVVTEEKKKTRKGKGLRKWLKAVLRHKKHDEN